MDSVMAYSNRGWRGWPTVSMVAYSQCSSSCGWSDVGTGRISGRRDGQCENIMPPLQAVLRIPCAGIKFLETWSTLGVPDSSVEPSLLLTMADLEGWAFCPRARVNLALAREAELEQLPLELLHKRDCSSSWFFGLDKAWRTLKSASSEYIQNMQFYRTHISQIRARLALRFSPGYILSVK